MTAVMWLGVAGLTLAAAGGGLLGAAVADVARQRRERQAAARRRVAEIRRARRRAARTPTVPHRPVKHHRPATVDTTPAPKSTVRQLPTVEQMRYYVRLTRNGGIDVR